MKSSQRSFLSDNRNCIYTSEDQRNKVIEAYLEKRLAEKEYEDFESHFFICDTCFHELQLREDLATAVREEGVTLLDDVPEESPVHNSPSLGSLAISSLRKYLSFKWFSFGLAFAVVLTLIVIGRGLLQAPDSEKQRRLFVANSEPSPFMENLLDRTQRAGNLIVFSPTNGVNVRNDLEFIWERDEVTELTIIILSNREEALFTFTTTQNEYVFEGAADQLQPGLYYWKLEDENELRHVGKFFVNKPD